MMLQIKNDKFSIVKCISLLFLDIEDSSSEDEQNADVRSKKKNSDVPDADEPMNSANQSPQDSPNSVRKMSVGSDNSDVAASKKERDHEKGQQFAFLTFDKQSKIHFILIFGVLK